MKRSALIILLIYLLVTFIGVTFAWMGQSSAKGGTNAVLEFTDADGNRLQVVSRDVTFSVKVYDEELDNYIATDNANDLIEKNDVIPNKPIYFKLIFTNVSEDTQIVSIALASMQTEYVDFFEYLYFGVVESKTIHPNEILESKKIQEYTYNSTVGTYMKLSDTLVQSSNGSYSATLLQDLYLLPTEETVTIELKCYLLLSRLAGPEFQSKNIDIGYFRAVL